MRLFGHPLHPMLVHFPIALWTIGSAADGCALLGLSAARQPAWLAIGAGDAIALLTMTAGAIDMVSAEELVMPLILRHMMLMGTAWLLYVGAFILRSKGFAPADERILLAALCGFAGFAALIAGAWCGGQLVYRHGVGIER